MKRYLILGEDNVWYATPESEQLAIKEAKKISKELEINVYVFEAEQIKEIRA